MDTLATFSGDFLCTDVSLALDEALYGTAVHATTWFILEYRESWRPKAPNDNDLPPHINKWLNQQLAAVENGRLQFIRKGKERANHPLAFYIASTPETHPHLYRFDLNSYDELLKLDVNGILAGDPAFDAYRVTDPMIIVCTHGKRDRCCALYGLPILNELQGQLGEHVWQTTHTGGHRFAPTLITFPDGTVYGRLSADDCAELVRTLKGGQLLLDNLRGRTCYGAVEQVADYLLRHETQQYGRYAYKHIRTEQEENQWLVYFLEPDSAQTHLIIIEEDPNLLNLFASSGSYKLKQVPQYTFISHDLLID